MNIKKIYASLVLALPCSVYAAEDPLIPEKVLLQLVLKKYLGQQAPLGNKQETTKKASGSGVRRIAWQALKAGTLSMCRCQFCKPRISAKL